MKAPRIQNKRVSSTRQRRQQHLLEVTVRRDKAIEIRNRAIFSITWKVALALTLIVGSYVGGKELLRRFLWENPDYYLSDIRVSTDGSLTREQILSTGEIVEGSNIFKVDLAKARTALSALAQTERVEIERVLPNRLNIEITERRPIAWVTARADEDPSASDKSFLIDARGIVMRGKTILPEYLHLPVISGVEVENLASGQRVNSLEMQAALELVRLNGDSTRFQARNIDIGKGYCLKVTDRNHAKITFGLDRVDLQLDRLNRLLDHLEGNPRELQTVNLLLERNIPVTFAPPAGSVPPEASTPKPEAGRDKLPPGKPAGNGVVLAKLATPKERSQKTAAAETARTKAPVAKAAPKATPKPAPKAVAAPKPAPASPPKPAGRAVPPGEGAIRNFFRLNG